MPIARKMIDLLRGVSRFLFYVTLVLCLIFLGSVNTIPFQFVAILGFANAILAGLVFGEPQETRGLFRLSLLVCLLVCAWTVLQSLPLLSQPLGPQVWREAQAAASPGPYSISLAPADSLEALPRLALPFILFATTLMLCQSDRRAVAVLRMLGLIGSTAAILGLGQFIFFKDMLLLDKKQFYLDSLTGVFVNRNTAGTFFGLTLMILLVLLWDSVRRWTGKRLSFGLLLEYLAGKVPGGGPSFIYAMLLAATFTALMLTKSRGGIAATAGGLLILVPFLIARFSEEGSGRNHRRWRLLIVASATFGLIGMIVLFSGQAMLRAQEIGLSDPRFCVAPGLMRLLADTWVTGTGPGSFQIAFTPYHDPACGIMMLWDRAHNVFIEGFIALGIVFPVAALVVLAGITRTLQTGLRRRRRMRNYPALGIAGMALVLLHSMVDFSLMIPGFALYFAAFLGAVLTISGNRPGSEPEPLTQSANGRQP